MPLLSPRKPFQKRGVRHPSTLHNSKAIQQDKLIELESQISEMDDDTKSRMSNRLIGDIINSQPRRRGHRNHSALVNR